MGVLIDSGDFPTSKGKKDGDLDRVIGQWQRKISSGFNEGAEWLLRAIQEVDDQELWRTYWGGGFGFNESREAFIARQLLVDFKIVETTVPAILEKLHRGEPVTLERKDGESVEIVPLAKHGAIGNGRGNNVTSTKTRGNATDYTKRRLARDRPDLLVKVQTGELTANQAAIEAGFRKPPFQPSLKDPLKAAETLAVTWKEDSRIDAIKRMILALPKAEFRQLQSWMKASTV